MSDEGRTLELLWPTVVDSSGGPSSGTKLNANLFDAMRNAVRDSIYNSDIDDGPPEIAEEVRSARSGYGTLDLRLQAIEAAAAGGAATSKQAALLNFIWNDALIWGAGDSAAPDGWVGAGMTIARIKSQPTPLSGPGAGKTGRNVISVTNPDATPRDFYFDVVMGTDLASYGNAALAGALWAGGIWIYSATSGLVTVHLEDANGSVGQIGQQGTTTGAWVWSANGAYEGGRTLGVAPTRLRFIVRMTAAGTAYLSGAMCGPGERCPYFVPPPVRRGQLSFSQGPEAAISTGIKSVSIANRPMFIYNGRVFLVSHGSGTGCTVVLYNDGDEIFNSGLVVGAAPSVDSGAKAPYSVQRASVSVGSNLTFGVSAAHADLRGINLVVDYIEPEILTDSLFGGGVSF